MKRLLPKLKNLLIMLLILAGCFGVSLLMQNVFNTWEHITTAFVFGVFLVSLCTEGYFYGIVASVLATVAVNYAFTFPYFSLNFTIPGNFFSALVMILLSVLTSALTTPIKLHQTIKAESQQSQPADSQKRNAGIGLSVCAAIIRATAAKSPPKTARRAVQHSAFT